MCRVVSFNCRALSSCSEECDLKWSINDVCHPIKYTFRNYDISFCVSVGMFAFCLSFPFLYLCRFIFKVTVVLPSTPPSIRCPHQQTRHGLVSFPFISLFDYAMFSIKFCISLFCLHSFSQELPSCQENNNNNNNNYNKNNRRVFENWYNG